MAGRSVHTARRDAAAKFSTFSVAVSRISRVVRRVWKLTVAAYDPKRGVIVDSEPLSLTDIRAEAAEGLLIGFANSSPSAIAAIVRAALEEMPSGGASVRDLPGGFSVVLAVVPSDSGGALAVLAGGFVSRTSSRGGGVCSEAPVMSGAEIAGLCEYLSGEAKELSALPDSVVEVTHEAGKTVIIGESRAMQCLGTMLAKLTDSESTVLIQGENGTGKEVVARVIYQNSPRSGKPFVTQSCSAMNENLLDSEMFGHVRGAFTGAIREKKGLFELADGGTLFLDEIGDMSPLLQSKVLRALQEGIFFPVGGTTPRHVDVRVLAATNRDLRRMVDEGTFREDLFYRINVINVIVPALRERREDIPLLADAFLRRFSKSKENGRRFSPEAMDALMLYDWPGNVRQLENEVQRCLVIAGRNPVIGREMLSPHVLKADAENAYVRIRGKLKESVEQLERRILSEGLRRHAGNRTKLARELGLSRGTLIFKLHKHGLFASQRS